MPALRSSSSMTAVDVAGLVGIARQRHGGVGRLDDGAQADALLEVAGLDQNDGVARGLRRQRLDVVGQCLLAAGIAHPEQPPVGKHRHGAGFVEQPALVAIDLRAVEPDHRERIVERQAGLFGKGLGPLGDQAAVGTVEQDDRDARVRLRQPANRPRMLSSVPWWVVSMGRGRSERRSETVES